MSDHAPSKYKIGQRVFYLTWHGEVGGVNHPCTACGQLHYSEKESEIVVPGTVISITWSERYTSAEVDAGWRYEIDADRDTRQGGTRGTSESGVYGTLEEAHAARAKNLKARADR